MRREIGEGFGCRSLLLWWGGVLLFCWTCGIIFDSPPGSRAIFGAVVSFILTLVLFAGLGLVGNVLVRMLIGATGDALGPTPTVVRIGLIIEWLAPIVLLLLLRAGLANRQVSSATLWPVWVPVYYYTQLSSRLYQDKVPLDLPFKTDATIKAEEYLLYGKLRLVLSEAQFRLRVFFMTFLSGGEK